MSTVSRVILNPRRARPFYGRHPWVYAGAIAEVQGNPEDGAEVEVISHGGSFIARGLYNGRSRIRVRLYTWQPDQPLDREFFKKRLEEAIALRRGVLGLMGDPGSACRLVFSEGDGLSGLTVDSYDRWLAVQFTSVGLGLRRSMFVELLNELVSPDGIYLRTERGIGRLEGLELEDGLLSGRLPDGPVVIREKGHEAGAWAAFAVNLAEGQKTGFYLDQRENRQAVARYAAGRRMLDAFCYTGGFGVHAAGAGAREVLGVDVSAPAIELARQNAARNSFANVSFMEADVFDFLTAAVQERRRYDLVVLDPPKFARAQHAVESARRGYRRLETLALLLLEPGGILVTCCCSGLITMEMLEELLAQVAAEAKRPLQILERRYQPADHPVSAFCLESSYLKCLISRVL
jgi:23S rRNA (cytosine1962-C5)-methyltransferase